MGIQLVQRIERAQNKIARCEVVLETAGPGHRKAGGGVGHRLVHVLRQHLGAGLFEIGDEVGAGQEEELFDVPALDVTVLQRGNTPVRGRS